MVKVSIKYFNMERSKKMIIDEKVLGTKVENSRTSTWDLEKLYITSSMMYFSCHVSPIESTCPYYSGFLDQKRRLNINTLYLATSRM